MAVENLLSPSSAAPEPADVTAGLAELYDGFRQEHLVALWTEIGDLMPASPRSRAVPHLWRWHEGLLPMARRAGQLVPLSLAGGFGVGPTKGASHWEQTAFAGGSVTDRLTAFAPPGQRPPSDVRRAKYRYPGGR